MIDHIFDSDPKTMWHSDGEGTTCVGIQITFKEPILIKHMKLQTRADGNRNRYNGVCFYINGEEHYCTTHVSNIVIYLGISYALR